MRRTKAFTYLPITVGILIIDRLLKLYAQGLPCPQLLPTGLIELVYVQNTGMAFSLLSGRPWLLGIMSAGLITAGFFILRQYTLGIMTHLGSALILGGALGNMIDRFFFGYVTDMIRLTFVQFAVFNAADAFLVTGCLLLMLSLLICPNEWEPKQAKKGIIT